MNKHPKLTLCAGIIVVILGICAPGIILSIIFSSKLNKPVMVENGTEKLSNTTLSRQASANITFFENTKLISGIWESKVVEMNKSESLIDEIEAVDIARSELGYMYKYGCYPFDFSNSYKNWYSWNAKFYKAVDTSFNTYSAYFWIITFSHYKTNEKHMVMLTENGRILAISNNVPRRTKLFLDEDLTVPIKNYLKSRVFALSNYTYLENQETSSNIDYEFFKKTGTEKYYTGVFTRDSSSISILNGDSQASSQSNFVVAEGSEIYDIYYGSKEGYFVITVTPMAY